MFSNVSRVLALNTPPAASPCAAASNSKSVSATSVL